MIDDDADAFAVASIRIKRVKLQPHAFAGEWNYIIHPNFLS
jgi:hypothetical protein